MSLASIQKIISINPIPNADNIEVAKVLGWDVVVKKGEFSPGDLCIYIEIDSLLPRKEWSEFLFKEGDDSQEYRLRTIKLRKQISQGLVIHPSSISDKFVENTVDYDNRTGLQFWMVRDGKDIFEGMDVTNLLGIKKYEHPSPSVGSGFNNKKYHTGVFPSFIPKTDEVRIQSAPQLLEQLKGKPYYITTKMDGTSATFFKYKGKFGVCSRKIEIRDPRTPKGLIQLIKREIRKLFGKTKKSVPIISVYWEVALKHKLDEIIPEGFAIQGEICGPDIQKNKMGLDSLHLYIFNVFHIEKHGYIYIHPWLDFSDLPSVNTVEEGNEFNYSLEELLKIANDLNYDNGTPAEGIVVRSLDQIISFKVVSNRFLLKYGE